MERNLFGSILYLAPQRKKDMGKVPSNTSSTNLCHIDGKMNKATKRTLMKELENSSETVRAPQEGCL